MASPVSLPVPCRLFPVLSVLVILFPIAYPPIPVFPSPIVEDTYCIDGSFSLY